MPESIARSRALPASSAALRPAGDRAQVVVALGIGDHHRRPPALGRRTDRRCHRRAPAGRRRRSSGTVIASSAAAKRPPLRSSAQRRSVGAGSRPARRRGRTRCGRAEPARHRARADGSPPMVTRPAAGNAGTSSSGTPARSGATTAPQCVVLLPQVRPQRAVAAQDETGPGVLRAGGRGGGRRSSSPASSAECAREFVRTWTARSPGSHARSRRRRPTSRARPRRRSSPACLWGRRRGRR